MKKEIINKNDEGQRLDRYFKKAYKKASLSYIYKLIRKDVKVNGKRQNENYILVEGDEISIYIPEEELSKISKNKAEVVRNINNKIKIVYENSEILIVDKAYGLLTHGDKNEKKNTLSNQVLDYLIAKGDYDPRSEKTFTPGPSNRLDRNTTGLVIFGKNAKSSRLINESIRKREHIQKYYLTLVKGEIKEKLFFNDWIGKNEEKNISVVDNFKVEDSWKEIVTRTKPIAYNKGYTLIEVEIPTGRSHQIRSHLQHKGFPLIGDPKYGDGELNKIFSQKYNIKSQLLHAYKLEFSSGIGKELMMEKLEIKVQPGKLFTNLIKELEIEHSLD